MFKGKCSGFEARLCLNCGSSPNYWVTMGREFASLNLSFFIFKMGFKKENYMKG